MEQPVEKSGMKRYALTNAGRDFLEEQKKLSMRPENKEKAMTFCLMDLLWFDGQDEIAGDLHKSMVRLVSALSEFNALMNRNVSKKAARDVKEIADAAAQKIEDINSSLKDDSMRVIGFVKNFSKLFILDTSQTFGDKISRCL